MDVRNLYKEQFEELREKLNFCDCAPDFEAIGADYSAWDFEDIIAWITDDITDDMVIKAFENYSFTCDDFFSTAGKYDLFPDK